MGILLCPAAGLKSCGNTGLDRTFQLGRGIFKPETPAKEYRGRSYAGAPGFYSRWFGKIAIKRCKTINCRISGTAQAVRCCKTGGLAPACALALNLDPVVYLLTSPKFFSRNGFWGLPPVS